MCPTVHGLGFVHCGQIAWKKWPTNWHAHVSRWLMLSCHWQLWVLLPMCLFDCLLVFSFVGFGLVRGGRYTRVNVLYSSLITDLISVRLSNHLVFFLLFFSKVRVGAKEGGSHYWEMAVAITCGYGGYLLPLLAAHSSFIVLLQTLSIPLVAPGWCSLNFLREGWVLQYGNKFQSTTLWNYLSVKCIVNSMG